jgi:hypothetical protein
MQRYNTTYAAILAWRPVADRPGAGTAHASMRSAGDEMRQEGKAMSSSAARRAIFGFRSPGHPSRAELVAALAQSSRELRLQPGTPENVAKNHTMALAGAEMLRMLNQGAGR